MGILRTDIISHSQLEGTGSVEFDGVGDYLTFAANNAFTAGESDVTFELWVYLTDSTNLSSGNYYLFDMGSNGYRIQIYNGTLYFGDGSNTTSGSGITKNAWHHVAGIRDGNYKFLYLDGNLVNTNACTVNHSTNTFTIGSYSTGGGDYEPYGYISNFRYVRGVVYKGPFTPPKFELKNIPGTIVLGCQSTTSATDFAVTPSTITANGDAAASAFHPGLKKDIIDTGVVFDGVTTFDSLAYMVPPSGKTSERNRGRGVLSGGRNNHAMQFINIQSQGNSSTFGDSITGDGIEGFAVGSSTRGLFAGGYPSVGNVIEFITFATTSNGTDFGDMTTARRSGAGAGNETRGLFAGGLLEDGTTLNTIEFSTIATLGNSTDFGDLTQARDQQAGCSDTTRAVFAGGKIQQSPSAQHNIIDFVTIATTGNAQDFGDLSEATVGSSGTSDSTRGIITLGDDGPNKVNTIEFITIQSAGNSKDFGDLTQAGYLSANMSNSTRAVFAGRGTPSASNTIDFVTVQTTGNANDFGDLIGGANFVVVGTSDSHGGLS